MKTYEISRTTVRKAVSELEKEQLVEKRRPKGVFVLKPKAVEVSNGLITSFTQEFTSEEYIPGSKILNFEKIPANSLLAEKLNLESGTMVYFVKRLRYINGEAVSISYAYVPCTIAPALSKTNFKESRSRQSLYYVLRNDFKVTLNSALETISAVILDEEQKRLMGGKNEIPAIKRSRQCYDNVGEIVLYEESIMCYTYKTTLIGI